MRRYLLGDRGSAPLTVPYPFVSEHGGYGTLESDQNVPMGMRSGFAVIGLVLVAGLATSCAQAGSDAVPVWVNDVCNLHASWVASDRPESDQDRDQVGRQMSHMLEETDNGATASAVRRFVDALKTGDPSSISEADDGLASACDDIGWEPAEG